MKKLFIIMLAVLLLAFSAAYAQETETVQEINWEDIAPAVEEAGLEGEFYNVADLGIAMWIPAQFTEAELTDEDIENGYLAYLTTEDAEAAVAVVAVDVEGTSLQDWMALLSEEESITEVEYGLINGIEAVTYNMPENDTVNVDFATDGGYIVEFTFWPASDEGFQQIAMIMIASIQTYEE